MEPFGVLESAAVPFPRANIDTDQILPARFLQKPRSGGFGQYLFHDLRFRADGSPEPGFVLNEPRYRAAKIVVAGDNFACGSSRENAVWALHDYGIRAVLAPSFGDIFAANSVKNGLLPVRLAGAAIATLLAASREPGAKVRIDLAAQTVTLPDGSRHGFEMEAFAKHCLLNGLDELDYTLTMLGDIEAFETRYRRERE